MKTSPSLLRDLQKFMINSLSFGDFVFRTPEGEEEDRAYDLRSLERKLYTISDETLLYHAERNHFSNWLKTRTEFWLAHKLRPRRVSDFDSIDGMRKHLINSLRQFRKERHLGNITDFHEDTFDPNDSFARIGGGSLGGKARGLAFANSLINNFNLTNFF